MCVCVCVCVCVCKREREEGRVGGREVGVLPDPRRRLRTVHSPGLAFRNLSPWRKDVVNQCSKFGDWVDQLLTSCQAS